MIDMIHPKQSPQNWEIDPCLELFIYNAEVTAKELGTGNEGSQVSISLFVGGLIVSGIIISLEEYNEKFWDGFFHMIVAKAKDAGESETPTAGNEATVNTLEPPSIHSLDTPARQYIHLKNARILHPSGHQVPPGEEGAVMRFRLAAVDGFMKETFADERRMSGQGDDRTTKQSGD